MVGHEESRAARRAPRWGARALLLAAAAAAALAPGAAARDEEARVFSNSGPTASEVIVREGEWAAQLARALDIDPVLPAGSGDRDLFSLLCPDAAELETDANARTVPARRPLRVVVEDVRGKPGEPLRVVVKAPATALYALTVRGAGAQRWSIDRRVLGHVDASPLGMAQVPAVVPLSAGPHELAAELGRGARVDRVELTAHRSLCIAPAGGWEAERPLTYGAKARTLVRAFGLERRLPDDGEPVLLEGERYARATDFGSRTNRRLDRPASGAGWATASGHSAEFTWRLRLDEPGLFAVLARVHGSGPQLWSLDGRYRVALHPTTGPRGLAWQHVATLPLRAGEHAIRALVPRDAGIDAIRLVRKRARDADYVDVLRELGLEEGAPDGYVTRSAARANLSHPTSTRVLASFLARQSGQVPDDGMAVLEYELDELYNRALSPVLPPEL